MAEPSERELLMEMLKFLEDEANSPVLGKSLATYHILVLLLNLLIAKART